MSTLHDGYFTAGLDADPELAAAIRGEQARQQDQTQPDRQIVGGQPQIRTT